MGYQGPLWVVQPLWPCCGRSRKGGRVQHGPDHLFRGPGCGLGSLWRRKKKQALAAGAATDVEAQVKSKVSEAGDKVKGAEDKVDAAKEVVEDKVEEVKEVVQKERKRKRRYAAKKVVEEVVEVEEVKVDVAAKAEAVKDAVDDVVGDDGIGLV